MRSVSISAEKQKDIEITIRNGIARVFLRTNHREIEETLEITDGKKTTKVTSTQWECDEVTMECADSDAPDVGDIEEDFDAWFDYVGDWKPETQKTLAQLQADVEYIAAVAGIELEV